MPEPVPAIRLDKWLWQARFFKTRALAERAVLGGGVRVNAVRAARPAMRVRVGDGLTIAQGRAIWAVRIIALGARRGPAIEARLLYVDLDPRPPGRESGRDTVSLEPPGQVDK